jgi:hypothetical protein
VEQRNRSLADADRHIVRLQKENAAYERRATADAQTIDRLRADNEAVRRDNATLQTRLTAALDKLERAEAAAAAVRVRTPRADTLSPPPSSLSLVRSPRTPPPTPVMAKSVTRSASRRAARPQPIVVQPPPLQTEPVSRNAELAAKFFPQTQYALRAAAPLRSLPFA